MTVSWLREHLEFQRDHPVPEAPKTVTAEPADKVVVLDSAVALGAERRAELDLRLRIYQDYLRHPERTWAELAARHGASVGKARYVVDLAEVEGERALVPGEWSRHSGIPLELQWKIIELHRSDMQRTPMDIYQDSEFQRLARRSARMVTYKQVWYFIRNLPDDPDADAQRAGRPRPLLPPHLSDGAHAYRATRPFQVLQADETVADVLTRTSDGRYVTKRVHILWAIDVPTRMIANFRVCIDRVTTHDVLCFFADLFAPKDERVRRAKAQHEWPVWGIPEIVLTDRGRVFAARAVREKLLALGVILEYAPAYQPHYKAIVERFQRTFNQLFAHRLPGAVRSGRHRRPYRVVRPEALRSGVLLPQLPALITRFVVDGYHERFHRGLRDFPIKRWRDLVNKFGPPRPLEAGERAQLRLQLMTRIRADRQGLRTLTKHGYSFLGHFFTPQLTAPRTAVISYDPRDVRRISVFTTGGAYVCEAYLRGWDQSTPVTAQQLRERNRHDSAMRARSARADRTITEIISAVRAGKKLTATDASKLERHREAVRTSANERVASVRRAEKDLPLTKLA